MKKILFALALVVCCVSLFGCLPDDAKAARPQHIDKDKDTVVLKDGNQIAGKAFRKDDKIGIIVPIEDVESILWAAGKEPDIRTTQRPAAAKPAPAKQTSDRCQRCQGRGYREDTCPTCNGTGSVECRRCHGQGYDTRNCPICHGQGWSWVKGVDGSKRQTKCACKANDPRQNSLVQCPECHGSGSVQCSNCKGSGKLKADCPYCTGGKASR